MAEITFAKSKRWGSLAKIIAKSDPKLKIDDKDDRFHITGPYITITREMVKSACFSNGAKNPKTVDKILYGLALLRKGRLIVQTDDKIVIGDDNGERAITVRFRVDQQQELAKYADELSISRNQFIINAIEHFIKFLKEVKNLPDLDKGGKKK